MHTDVRAASPFHFVSEDTYILHYIYYNIKKHKKRNTTESELKKQCRIEVYQARFPGAEGFGGGV